LVINQVEGTILKHSQIIINALGAINGARRENDSISYFGVKLYDGSKAVNDFALNLDELNSRLEHLFIIYYKRGRRF
jgi:hypothetical protein